MLRNFFISSLCILWRNKVTSFVNIFSLNIGLTACSLIVLYVHHEISYDKFNENYDRIYRLQGNEYAMLCANSSDYQRDSIYETGNINQKSLCAYLAFRFFNISGKLPGINTVKKTNIILVNNQISLHIKKVVELLKKYLGKSKWIQNWYVTYIQYLTLGI